MENPAALADEPPQYGGKPARITLLVRQAIVHQLSTPGVVWSYLALLYSYC